MTRGGTKSWGLLKLKVSNLFKLKYETKVGKSLIDMVAKFT
jgi:hypothetical protein